MLLSSSGLKDDTAPATVSPDELEADAMKRSLQSQLIWCVKCRMSTWRTSCQTGRVRGGFLCTMFSRFPRRLSGYGRDRRHAELREHGGATAGRHDNVCSHCCSSAKTVQRSLPQLGLKRTSGEDFEGQVPTYFGGTTRHEMLERTVWHSTQHVRQVASLLEQCGHHTGTNSRFHRLSISPACRSLTRYGTKRIGIAGLEPIQLNL